MTSVSGQQASAVLHPPIFLSSFALLFLMFGLPIFGRALGASAVEIGALYSVFTATIMIFRPVAGWGLDRFGRKRFLIAAMLSYAVAMALYASATTLPALYVARLAEGVAAACLWPSARTIASDLSLPEDRGQAMGRLQEMLMRGGMVGVVLGFFLVSVFPKAIGWRGAFSGYAALAAAGAYRVWQAVPETSGMAAPSARRGKAVVSRTLLALLGIVFTTGFSTAMLAPIYLIFVQDRFTTDIFTLGWAFFPAGIVASLLPSRVGRLSDRAGRAPLMAAGLIVTGLLSLLLPHLPSITWLIVLYTVSAVGWSMAEPVEAAMVADLTRSEKRGTAYGLYEFARGAGAALGPLFGGWLYDSSGHAAPFYLSGLVLCVGAMGVWALLREGERGKINLRGV